MVPSLLRELDTSALEYRDVLLAFPYCLPLRATAVLIAALPFSYPPVSQSHPDKRSCLLCLEQPIPVRSTYSVSGGIFSFFSRQKRV